jgi:hypothetical protein
MRANPYCCAIDMDLSDQGREEARELLRDSKEFDYVHAAACFMATAGGPSARQLQIIMQLRRSYP